MVPVLSSGRKRATVALVLFGVSFGYVEAAVVTYSGALYEPVRERFYPNRPRSDVFPLLTERQLKEEGPQQLRLMKAELVREAATLAMLCAVAIGVGRNGMQALAAFLVAFGTWDISFYAFLKLLDGWPASLLTWDLLFLLPVPWAAPVLAPVLVSLSMIGAGLVLLGRDWTGSPVRLGLLHRLGLLAAGAVLVMAFTWDFRNIAGGGLPRPFNWPLFALGEAIGLATFLHALRAGDR
jgi:hypothetical protein